MKEIKIKTEYITLGQLLKFASITNSGGETKIFLSEYEIKVNGELENRRGKKLRQNDVVEIEDFGTFKIS
ncbi:S4 domain-containing protein YaaA [Mycoplasmatota bacterium WC44]